VGRSRDDERLEVSHDVAACLDEASTDVRERRGSGVQYLARCADAPGQLPCQGAEVAHRLGYGPQAGSLFPHALYVLSSVGNRCKCVSDGEQVRGQQHMALRCERGCGPDVFHLTDREPRQEGQKLPGFGALEEPLLHAPLVGQRGESENRLATQFERGEASHPALRGVKLK
jgi:hypothetical protein